MQNEETIWIVTDNTPQITIPENVTRKVTRRSDSDEDVKKDSDTRSVGDALRNGRDTQTYTRYYERKSYK